MLTFWIFSGLFGRGGRVGFFGWFRISGGLGGRGGGLVCALLHGNLLRLLGRSLSSYTGLVLLKLGEFLLKLGLAFLKRCDLKDKTNYHILL